MARVTLHVPSTPHEQVLLLLRVTAQLCKKLPAPTCKCMRVCAEGCRLPLGIQGCFGGRRPLAGLLHCCGPFSVQLGGVGCQPRH